MSNITLFAIIFLTLFHVNYVVCIACEFFVVFPCKRFIHFDFVVFIYKWTRCTFISVASNNSFEFFSSGFDSIGQGTFALISKSQRFFCFLNAVNGGSLKTCAKYQNIRVNLDCEEVFEMFDKSFPVKSAFFCIFRWVFLPCFALQHTF